MDKRLSPAGLASMEAKLVDRLPDEQGWQFEPKWDGFRCLAFRNGDAVTLISKSGKPLTRYFPEVAAALGRLPASSFIIDGELIVPVGDILSFSALQARLHPAASRIAKLSAETPAQFMLFDCLQTEDEALIDRPLVERRAALQRLLSVQCDASILLSPASTDPVTAASWLSQAGGALDGVIAKRQDDPYRPGERAMLKVKQYRSADCVVGGFRYGAGTKQIASLLLGLYNDAGQLDHVGFTSAIADEEKPALTKRLKRLAGGTGFDGKAPGGPNRWSTERSNDWQPLVPELVVEVLYDQVTAQRFRHGTKLLRWRQDKAARQCRMDQLLYEVRPSELIQLID